ncbi:MAG: DUF1636 domain-containing protein [Marinibacterium sp.]|nr:DUF1636 domain-containing protein [Marinibacterium sp.]
MTTDHTILVCTTCIRDARTDPLGDALRARLPDGFALAAIDCMAGCERKRTVGFQATGKASYLFGDLVDDDCDALLDFARQYRASPDGWTSATERPRPLLRKTLARIPAMGAKP